MNNFIDHRRLGLAGIIGGLSYAGGGLRMLLLGVGEDRLTDVLGIIWAACWIAGGFGLLRLRVTGPTRMGRAMSTLVIIGFTTALFWGLFRLIDPVAANRSILAIAPLLVIIGMLGTGVLVLRAHTWLSWHRWIPLAIASIYIVTIAVTVVTGMATLGYAFTGAGIGYVLLGNSIHAHHTNAAVEVRGIGSWAEQIEQA